MATHTLGDVGLFLKDLFESKDKHKLLVQTKAGALYGPLLAAKKKEIEALPPALVGGGRPLADRLGSEDALHDGYGAAIWHLIQAYRALPDLDDTLRASIERLSTDVIEA